MKRIQKRDDNSENVRSSKKLPMVNLLPEEGQAKSQSVIRTWTAHLFADSSICDLVSLIVEAYLSAAAILFVIDMGWNKDLLQKLEGTS